MHKWQKDQMQTTAVNLLTSIKTKLSDYNKAL